MKIGIITGAGALIGAKFYNDLIVSLNKKGAINDHEYPEIILHQYPFNLNDKGYFDTNKTIKNINNSLKLMNDSNINTLVYLCNSITELIQDKNAINIIDETTKKIDYIYKNEKIKIIASEYTIKNRLYANRIMENDVIESTQSEIDIYTDIINLILQGKNKEAKKIYKDLIKEYKKKNYKVILGCTEFNIINKNKEVIDCVEVIKESLLEQIKLK